MFCRRCGCPATANNWCNYYCPQCEAFYWGHERFPWVFGVDTGGGDVHVYLIPEPNADVPPWWDADN